MNLVKIEIHVDVENPKQTEALRTFLNVLGGQDTAQDEPKSAKATEKAPNKLEKVEEIEVKEAKEVQPTEEATEKEAEVEEPKKAVIDITEVRSVLATKVGAHRDRIKNKLEKLDAKNVTSLKVENYQEFLEFLNSLD